MSEVSYVLPPTEEMYDVLLQGLKRFSDDLQTGATDSSALGYGWSPAPFAAKISAPRLLRPKPPSLSLSLRDAEVRPPGPASARTTMHSTPERPRRPSSAGQRNEEPLPRMSGRGPNAAQTASELKLKAQGQQLTLPPPKSSRQRSQKNLHMAKPFKTNALMQPPVQPGTGTTDRAERAERAERTGPTSASQLSPQVLPAMHKQPRSLEEHIASSSQRLLLPGKPTLVWKTVDSEADYRQLRAGEYFNHFQQNRVLTTKAGLAQSLKEYSTSSGVNADDFFPRCYDTAQKSERDDFILDFRRSSALRVALLHRRMRRDHLEGLSSSYMCNETILDACHLVLQRWLCDLDPEHLDEDDATVSGLSEETWEALTLYSTLAQSELLGTSEPQRPRLERSRLAEAALPLKRWPEFLSHRWGPGESESLEAVLTRLESLFPQWSLHGGWLGQNVWIVKPGTNSKGSGIECFSKLTELLQHVDRMPNRICQKYVERPLLLFSGRKFDIRQWVLVRSVQPLKVFLFSECYLRLCNGMYDLGDLRDRERHISNWQVNKHGKNVVEGAVVSLQDFREELEALTGLQEYWERHLLPQLKHIVIEVMRASRDLLTPRRESFELFGFDVMVDEAMKLWLLEVNLSPGCDSRTSFMEKMLTRMSHRLVEVAVLGREEPDGEEPDWIKIYDDSGQAAAASGPPRSAEDLRIQGTQLRIGKTKGASKSQEAHVAFAAEETERSPHEAKDKVRKGTGYVTLAELPDEEERGVTFEVSQVQQDSGETRKSVRKGTGFLHPSDLPDDDEEEEEEREVRFTTPQAAGVGGSPKEKVRKGTGYVALSDLPDDEEEETNRGVSFEVASQASNGQGETRKSVRKGTGFLHPSDLPDDDEEEEEEREVRFTTPQAAGVGGSPKEKVRKGTGYVALSDLPDDEEDSPSRAVSIQAEGEEGQPKPKVRQDTGSVSMSELPEEGSVSFNLKSKAGQTSGEPKEKVRKGTGFVSLSDLPPSDDEDVAPSVSFQVKEGGGQPKAKAAVRKGTGFVDASEILDDDEEDEEESRVRFEAGTDTGEAKVQKVKKARRDTGFVSHSDIPDEEEVPSADVVPEGSKQKAKKGAVFVDPNDLPDDDAEDGVRFNLPAEVKTKPAGPKVKARRGTGFVQESELPPEDREEDPDAAVSFLPSKSGSPAGKAKKGTGFVNLADLPPSDDEDDAARVSFQVDGGSGKPRPKKAVRKGTGFVDASEIPDEEEEHNVKFAAGTDGEAAAKQKKARRGTGFVQESELPPDDSQETSVNFDLPAQAKASETPKAKVRKGTGFVNAADLPVSDEEEEVTTSASLKAKKGGAVVVSPSDLPPDEDEDAEDSGVTLNVPKVPADDRPEEASVSFDLPVQTKKSSEKAKTKVRKGTGFVNAADLPVSDEEEEVTATASVKARKGGAVVVNPNDLPPDDDEEESERAVRFNAAETAVPHPKARRGTGFVAEAELPEDDEEFEDDFEEESGGEESP